jgi:hypothetical protein
VGVFNIFSKRNNRKEEPIFRYDVLPEPFRVQLIHILRDSVGSHQGEGAWKVMHDALCKEYGVFSLLPKGTESELGHINSRNKCMVFIKEEEDVLKVLDIIELAAGTINGPIRENRYRWDEWGVKQYPDDALDEINQRFREHGIGYQFIENKIVRVDSQFIQQEVVEPAVELLFKEDFEGASDEFIRAHDHFKKDNDKEAITEALKAFESTMRTICNRMGWEVSEKATAKHLIQTLFDHKLIPSSLQSQLSSLRSTLEGLPTLRNKLSGHGQGERKVEVPKHVTAYAMHLCATNIVFLIEAYKKKK